MVRFSGASNPSKQFILVAKNLFDDQTISHPVNNQSSEQPQEEKPIQLESTTPSVTINDALKQKIYSELETLFRSKRSPQSKTWKAIDVILFELLTNPSVNVQFSNLELTVDGNTIQGVFAPQFIYSLLRHNKKIPIETYTLILQRLKISEDVVKNRDARLLLRGITPLSIVDQQGSGKIKIPKRNGNQAENQRKSQKSGLKTGQKAQNQRHKQKSSPKTKQRTTGPVSTPWISF